MSEQDIVTQKILSVLAIYVTPALFLLALINRAYINLYPPSSPFSLQLTSLHLTIIGSLSLSTPDPMLVQLKVTNNLNYV